ncbi:hypothetical protein COU61_05170 [Candidatus Pacearchaeota archaeon CG10_big_fil_rev_8_21_14_0_10_35_13]|nr:MAG: hypothetical protein COU61_05170 [Candidatus Pacearchaeota archaeon CG10_big_fil_rev_8_21_14_0_10_35_13]
MESPTTLKRCIRCQKTSEDIKLLDALKEGRPVIVCESCSRYEDVIIIRKPTSKQLSSPNKHKSVYERLKKMAGLEEELIEEKNKVPSVYELVNKNHETKERMMSEYSIKKRKELAERLNKPTNLKEHYNWISQRERRKKGITLRRFSEMLGEQEGVIKMFEEGMLTDDSRRIAEKIEQLLKISLLKTLEETERDEEEQRIHEARKKARIEAGVATEDDKKPSRNPSRMINFNPETLKNLTISDLAEMKKRMNKDLGIAQVVNKEREELNKNLSEEKNLTTMGERSIEEAPTYKGMVVFYEE